MTFTSCCLRVGSSVQAGGSHSSVWSRSSLLQTNSANWFYCCRQRAKGKVNSLENTKLFMTNIWKSLLGKEQQGEEGRENTPALIVCVSLGGLHDRQAFSSPGHYSIKEDLETEDWPQHRHYRTADGRHAGAQCSTPPEASRGHYWSLTPHAASSVPGPHYHDHFLQHLLFFRPCNTHRQELWRPQQRMYSTTGWSCFVAKPVSLSGWII